MNAVVNTVGGVAPGFATDFLNALADRVVLLDPAGRVTCLSEASAVVALQEMAPQTLLRPGVSYLSLCRRAEAAGLDAAGSVAAGVTAVLRGTRPDVRLRLGEGEQVLELQANPLQAGSLQRGGAVVVHRDVTSAAARLAELSSLAYSDSLTGLHNRRYFLREAESRLGSAQRAERAIALIYLDLDGFKGVNDSHGHAVGDAVLKIMSVRLQGLLRSSDLLARLGGDEFVFLVQVTTEAEVAGFVARIRHALRQPVALNGVELRLGVSVGVALPNVGDDVAALLEQADRRMYAAKDALKPPQR